MNIIESRFWSRVNKTDSCWLWTGGLNNTGYGVYKAYGKAYFSHRFSYELLVGPIPEGLVLDHLCRVITCVNPEHLEPVTQHENILRGTGFSAIHAAKTHCSRGHEYSGNNTYSYRGSRYCKQCDRDKKNALKPCPECGKVMSSGNIRAHRRRMHGGNLDNPELVSDKPT